MPDTKVNSPRKSTRKSKEHPVTNAISHDQAKINNPDQQILIIDDLTEKLDKAENKIEAQANEINELKEKNTVLLKENEKSELIDDLTGRLQELEIKLAATSVQSKHIAAQNISKTHMIAGMSLGLLPAPLFDIAALTGTQLSLIRSLSKHYNIDFDEKKGKVLVTSLLTGSLPVLTVVGLSSIAKVIPGIGTIGGGIGMTVMAGAAVYATGQVFIRHFEVGGTLQDFDSKHWQAFFRQQLEEGKSFVKNKTGNSQSKYEQYSINDR